MTHPIAIITLDNEPRVDSRLIAEQLGAAHQNVRELIQDYQADFEEFGKLRFETEASGKTNQQQKFILLNEDQSYLLLTYIKNTPQARDLKKRLVRAFADCRRSVRVSSTARMDNLDALRLAREAARTAKAFGFTGNMIALSADCFVRKLTGVSVLASMEATHLIANDQGRTYSPTELGKMCSPPLSGQKINLLMEAAGLQAKEFGYWIPTDTAESLFEWLDTNKRHSNGTPIKQLRWFRGVLDRLNIDGQKEAA